MIRVGPEAYIIESYEELTQFFKFPYRYSDALIDPEFYRFPLLVYLILGYHSMIGVEIIDD